jgi:hypothetical protein
MIYRLLFLICLFFCIPAQAQDIITFPPGEDVIIVLDKDDPAPFRGQLFDADTAIRWGYWLEQYKLRLKLDVEAEQKKCDAKLDYGERELKIEREKNDTIYNDLRERLIQSEKAQLMAEDEARNPPFWKTFEFGLLVGIAGSALVGVLSVWGITQATK